MSKNLLMIGQFYYPSNTTGAHRPAKTAKYLPRFGWTPVMLTADWTPENSWGCFDPQLVNRDPSETVRVPFRFSTGKGWRAALRRLQFKITPLHYTRLFHREMLERARRLARERKFDAIWATNPSDVSLRVADAVSREFGIPWVADFRDLPDEAPVYPAWYRRWRVHLEVASCRSASALVTVSQPLAAKLAERHAAPVHVVFNGFDPDDFPCAEPARGEHFDIVYCGTIYAGRDPAMLFDALDLALARDAGALARLRVHFYGITPEQLSIFLQGRRCAGMAEALGRKPFSEVIRAEQQAAALLLLSHGECAGIMTAKIFEYLGARRPVLSVPGDNNVTDALLRATRAGVAAHTKEEAAKVLLDWYAEWEKTGTVAYDGLPAEIAQYTREGAAQKTAAILDAIAGGSRGSRCLAP